MDEVERVYNVYDRAQDIIEDIDDYYNENYGDIDTTPEFRREFYNEEINNIIEDLQNETPVDNELIDALRDTISPSLSPRDGGFMIGKDKKTPSPSPEVKKANKGGIIRNSCVY